MLALLLVASSSVHGPGLVALGAKMASGSWLNTRKEDKKRSHEITGMNPDQGSAANLSMAMLVTTSLSDISFDTRRWDSRIHQNHAWSEAPSDASILEASEASCATAFFPPFHDLSDPAPLEALSNASWQFSPEAGSDLIQRGVWQRHIGQRGLAVLRSNNHQICSVFVPSCSRSSWQP
jgi:hypothetical protein